MEENKIVIYQTDDVQTLIDVRLENETLCGLSCVPAVASDQRSGCRFARRRAPLRQVMAEFIIIFCRFFIAKITQSARIYLYGAVNLSKQRKSLYLGKGFWHF